MEHSASDGSLAAPSAEGSTSVEKEREEDLVEAAGVEPASENVTGQENYMLSRVHAPGITLGRSRPSLRTDKKRLPLA
jgi:hypothetical protein